MQDQANHLIQVDSRAHPVPYADPFEVYQRLCERYGDDSVFLLESLSGPETVARRTVLGIGPLAGLRLYGRRVVWHGHRRLVRRLREATRRSELFGTGTESSILTDRDRVWDLLRRVRDQFAVTATARDVVPPGFRFGFFGYLGYDMAWSVERLPRRISAEDGGLAMADMDLTIYQATIEYDLTDQTAKLVVNHSEAWPRLDVDGMGPLLQPRLPAAPRPARDNSAVPEPLSVTDSIERDDYLRRVDRALEHIGRGDIYQVQLGHALTVRTSLAPFDAYRRIRSRNPSPYGYIARFGRATVLGASPELFVRSEGGFVTMKPIAGTAPRRPAPADDLAARDRLRSDKKEIAEHVMLVDLCRNDVGRICQSGTLRAVDLMALEPYSHVHHLVSTVTGRLGPGHDEYDVITAAFPAGTMTGAPKVRAMEIIEALETTRRGLYAGVIGLIDFGGYLNTALCIRSAVHRKDAYQIRASAGVVADSDPAREWDETLQKLGATHWALTGQEVNRARAAR